MQESTHLADAMIAELDQEAASTRRVLERFPEDRMGWRPHPKSMSLGQLALHIATTPAGVAQIAAMDSVEAPDFTRLEAGSKAEVLDAHERSLSAAKEFLRHLSDERAEAAWTMTRAGTPLFSLPRIELVRSIMLRHVYHHRGELCVYLRLLDVPVPAIYGPSADEDPFA
ncbi:MAG: DinB family protein [Gemmatimonadota bacterium]|nr:DinB family protein [Gemmatimonadales bacterium]MDQ3137451.1 DinB family protein [Gemmatimonadota bacterium]